ncbi:MAG: hypothetical protein Ct9H300mP32_1750 [Verrucomicrobiota bacterium]|nr:MAG: hypothetical protein Ct9H300mP32_1750 [Verrucomicrobiota bacterium]
MPTIRVIEHRNQLVQSGLSKPRQLRLNEVFRHNPVNPAGVVAAIKVYMLLNACGSDHGCSRDFAIHIGDVQRPSGPTSIWTGRNQLSVEARNSRSVKSSGRSAINCTRGKQFFAVNQVAPGKRQ